MNHNGGLKGNMMYLDENRERGEGKEEHQIGGAVWQRGASIWEVLWENEDYREGIGEA